MGTKIWGPLGWMTLHSISAIYPEEPTQADKELVDQFMNAFRETIACPYCKTHFTTIFNKYKQFHPEWSSSRQSLFVFICRAHNTVNRRLDKPIYKTVLECIETLKNATTVKGSADYRKAYLDYLVSNWGRQTDGEGLMMMSFVRKMIKINNEYFNPRNVPYSDLTLREDNVLEFIPEDNNRYRASHSVLDPIRYRNIKVGFRSGSLIKR